MNDHPLTSIRACFSDLYDPRVTGRCDDPLIEIITRAICAVVAGADSGTEIEIFGKRKEAWLKQFLPLEKGIPSHDRFGDVFRVLNAAKSR